MSERNNQTEQERQVTLGDDYQLLLAGRRLKSSRNSSVTVSERERKLQLEQMQQTIQRKRDKQKKKGKKPGKQPQVPPSKLRKNQSQQSTRLKPKFQEFSPEDVFENPDLPLIPAEIEKPKTASYQSPIKPRYSVKGSEKDIFEQLAEYQVLCKVLPLVDHCAGIYVQTQNKRFGQVLEGNSETLKVQNKNETTTEDLAQTKFLCGAYWCSLAEIDFTKVNDNFSHDFEIRAKDHDSDRCIIIIQTVSQSQDSVVHRLHALIMKGSTFVLHPASFKTNPKLQRQRIQSDAEDQEMVDWWYKSDVNAVLQFAKKIEKAFDNYRTKVSKVQLNDANAQELLYSICHIHNPSHRVGVLTRVHQGQAFIRLLGAGADENIQMWSDYHSEKIEADLTIGYVSQQSLYQPNLFDIKIRKITFTSRQEHCLPSVQAQTEQLCKSCYYPRVDGRKVKVCSRCNYFLHEECLKPYQLSSGSESQWLCPQCVRCETSKACSSNLLVCGQCNTAVHADCIDPHFNSAIQTHQLQDHGKPKPGYDSEFRCEHCIRCTACDRTTAGDMFGAVWSSDFKLCAACDKKRDQKLYCLGCLRFLPEDSDKTDLLRCAGCNMWIHQSCDRMLEDPTVLARFNETILYACVSCRQKSRADFIDQIVDLMIQEDKKNEFLHPFWQHPPNQVYLQMIKEPICFQLIKDQIQAFQPNYGSHKPQKDLKYLTKPDAFKCDIDRIFRNAKSFNPIQSEIHKLALRMHEKCNQILNSGRIWEIFEINSKVTHDELANLNSLRSAGETPKYHLKPKDLFVQHEQVDIRQYQFYLQQQEKTQLGKRSSRDQQSHQSKRFKLDENRETQAITQSSEPITTLDHKKIMHEANRRLLLQNLGNLLQNLQNKQLQGQRDKLPLHDHDHNQVQLSPKSRWQALMNDLRTSDEYDTCWYSSPMRVSFDDPSLIFEEMCYLCGAFGNRDDFLGCNFCGESFHPYCLPCPKESKQGLQDHWFCYNCIFCEKCHSSRNWEFLVLCAVCDKAYHFQCLEPQLIQVPECSWKCPDCFKCRTCGTKDFFSPEDIENKVNLDPNEKYILSFDFEFCYQCGQDHYRKSFCNICRQKSGLGLEPIQGQKKNYYQQVPLTSHQQCEAINLYKCVKCKFYAHLECSRTTQETLSHLEGFEGFICLDCLLVDKQPGYYLHEQCKLFEDFSDRVMRFQVLKMLCSQLVACYTQDDIIVHQYVKQNQSLLESDNLIQKWLQLLRTEVDTQSESNHEDDIDNNALLLVTEIDRFTTNDSYSPKKKRDLYTSLYTKNKQSSSVGTIPIIEMREKDIQVNWPELYAQIEFRAVCKIKHHFMMWAEQTIGAVLSNQNLFMQPAPIEEIAAVDHPMQEVEQPPIQCIVEPQQKAAEIVAMCEEPDHSIDNPQRKLTCILCCQSGEKRVTGRLIPFQVNQFVHVNCAMWTSEVQEGTEESVISSELYNFFFAFKHFRHNTCAVCGLKGATLICANHSLTKKCAFYHFPCAYASGQVSFQNTCEIYCGQCSKKEKDVQIGLPLKFRDYHKRRVTIVKNLLPQCTSAFSGGQPVEEEQGKQASAPYIVDCNKWRPFYYDMFNRAGNLTILSLSQSANSIIQSLHNISHQQTTWHQRFNKKDTSESHTDYASLRIFWKNGTKDKAYYLYNDEQVTMLQRPHVQLISDFVSKLMRQKLPSAAVTSNLESIRIQQFWQNQIQFLRQRYQNFSQDSTYLTSALFTGLQKYPIQFWNNPQDQVKLPLKDMSVVNFFYKSADRVIKIQQLYTQKSKVEPTTVQIEPQGDLHQIFNQILKANKFVNKDGFSAEQAQNLRNSKFQQPQFSEASIKQQLGSLDKSQPVFNQLSARNMNYEQIMGCLGKKTMTQRQKIRNAQQMLHSDSDDNEKEKNQQMVEADLKTTDSGLKGCEVNIQMRYRAAKDRPRAVEVWTSKIHRNGLFACQQFMPKDVVIEYVGEKIRIPVSDKREKLYEKLGVGDCYFFTLDETHVIDATFWGNKARYINHSCDPNLKSDKVLVNGEMHIIFIANRQIESGEELTFDYQFDYEDVKIECFCGSAKCKGRLN